MVPESKRVQTATDGLARRTGPVHARHGTMVPASGPMAKRPCVEMALEGVSQCCSGVCTCLAHHGLTRLKSAVRGDGS